MNMEELEKNAERVCGLPRMVYGYYASGADSQVTLRDNRDSFGRYKLFPRVLRDVSDVDTSVNVLGMELFGPELW
jgi:isopentenyl diphosphate isomerase/L-lactate dehydrogenase-like FMN-dependent dehydrogenase